MMVTMAPILSIYGFIIAFMAVLLIARFGVELYVRKEEKENAHQTQTRQTGVNKTIQRYYNRKGA